jgi:hypothetical protein
MRNIKLKWNVFTKVPRHFTMRQGFELMHCATLEKHDANEGK